MYHSTQKSVLIINYYWPPAGGPAVQRWVDIIRAWNNLNVSCYILTVDENKATYQVIDQSLEKKVPENVNIYRTATSEFFSVYKKYVGNVPANAFVNEQNPSIKQKIARFIRGNFFIPDPRKGWNRFAYKKAREIIRNFSIELIITAGPPHSTHLIGLRLKKKLGIHWIADFHDYWTDIFYLKDFYRTPPARLIDKYFEKKVLGKADLILSHCQFAKKLYSKKLNLINDNKIAVHTMGYDSSLFLPVQESIQQSAFTITYSGMMPENYEPEVFFKVMERIIHDFTEIPIIIRFIGLFSQGIGKLAPKYNLGPNWEETGYIEHTKVPSYLYSSSVLLLVNPNVTNEKMIVPGKIYEYLAVRKPIVSIAGKDSENAYLIEFCEAGRNFERDQEHDLHLYITELIEKWKIDRHVDLKNSNTNYLNFDREREAIKLLESIKKLIQAK